MTRWVRLLLPAAAVLAFVLFTGCGAAPEPAPAQTETTTELAYEKISPDQAKDMMEQGGPYILLDCRTEEEFAQGHIEGAVLIPYDEIEGRAATELPDRDALILIYCRSGRRSEIAAQALIAMGYTNVRDFGGIIDWLYETVSGY